MRRPPPTGSQITVNVPPRLHPASKALVQGFAAALAEKLRAAELKYEYSDGWKTESWEEECRQHMHDHVAKGDPRDVAIYCAFMWARGWSTKGPLRKPASGLMEAEIERQRAALKPFADYILRIDGHYTSKGYPDGVAVGIIPGIDATKEVLHLGDLRRAAAAYQQSAPRK